MLDRLSPPVRSYDFDHDLIQWVRETGKPRFDLYPFPFPAVVAGQGTRLDREIRTARCMTDGIPVYRRMGGGCAVFLDPGNLIVSVALPAKGFAGIRNLFDRCNQWLITGFTALGIDGIYQDGISDLVMKNRKIGGTCLYRTKDLAYYAASLLVNPNLDHIEQYLRHPPREPAYRRKRRHWDFVTRLDRVATGLTPDSLASGLTPILQAARI